MFCSGSMLISKLQRRDSGASTVFDWDQTRPGSVSEGSGVRKVRYSLLFLHVFHIFAQELFGFRRTLMSAVKKRQSGLSRESCGKSCLYSTEKFLISIGFMTDIEHPREVSFDREVSTSGTGNLFRESQSLRDQAYKEIFCFSVCQPKTGFSASANGDCGGFEIILASPTRGEALAWVSNINSISGSGSN